MVVIIELHHGVLVGDTSGGIALWVVDNNKNDIVLWVVDNMEAVSR